MNAFDSLPPQAMARKAEEVGCSNARMTATNTFALAVLAGAFIAMGAIFATTVTAGGASPSWSMGTSCRAPVAA